jgi:hypothetical protein
MMQSFGDHLNQFAQTVDIVPDSVYYEVLGLIQTYLRENLNAGFFAVAIEKVVRLQPFLFGEWPRERPWWSARVKNDQGIFIGQTALAYAIGRPLWIVGNNRVALKTATAYQDLLNNAAPEEIPKYEEVEDISAKTSIILPLRTEDEHFGIINIESRDYIELTDPWLFELKKLANAIAILHQLKTINRLQTKSTLEAKDRLEHGDFVPVVKRRTMFFASSARGDNEVIDTLKDVLSDYRSYFALSPWTDLAYGNIHEKIWERISSCMYGMCYLSEPISKDAVYRFKDNPNVLFEAGMLFALQKAKRSPLQGILLVRESDSADIPFDLSAEYMVMVPRSEDGQLDRQRFRDLLVRHISFMLGISNPR